jgi:hypothetical protein
MKRADLAVVMLVLGACGGGRATEPAATTSVSVSSTNAAGIESSLACMGHWTGSAVQDGAPWNIDLVISPVEGRGPCGTIEYPSLGCGGQILDCAVLPDGRLTMRELYTHNPGTCAPAGQIYAFCSPAHAGPPTMVWTWEGEGGPVTTTLVRQ